MQPLEKFFTGKRVAVELSGALRSRAAWQRMKASSDQLLDSADRVDWYLATWDTIQHSDKEGAVTDDGFSPEEALLDISFADHKFLKFGPRMLHELGGVAVPRELLRASRFPVGGTLPQFFLLQKCSALRISNQVSNRITYDIVIRVRPDIDLKGVKITSCRILKPNFVAGVAPQWKYAKRYLWDGFFLADPISMAFLASTFDFLRHEWTRSPPQLYWSSRYGIPLKGPYALSHRFEELLKKGDIQRLSLSPRPEIMRSASSSQSRRVASSGRLSVRHLRHVGLLARAEVLRRRKRLD